MYVCVYTFIYTCVCIYVYIYVYTCMYLISEKTALQSFVFVCMCIFIHIYICICVYMCIYMCIYKNIYIYTYIHIICIHALLSELPQLNFFFFKILSFHLLALWNFFFSHVARRTDCIHVYISILVHI